MNSESISFAELLKLAERVQFSKQEIDKIFAPRLDGNDLLVQDQIFDPNDYTQEQVLFIRRMYRAILRSEEVPTLIKILNLR